ncbi:putative baseplate assembly protein [Streptomyces sp. bgisy153]|uniref:putative baseplate assembly protein n=1 Tax=Streptomyces sp. bgisy153 TaxID=3413793 RepID=UPI003D732197
MTVLDDRDEGLGGRDPAAVEDVLAHPDGRTLTVSFSGVLPEPLDRTRFVIEGGRRVVGIRVLRVVREAPAEGEGGRHRVRLLLDRPGDESTYRLRALGRGFHAARNRADFGFGATVRTSAPDGPLPPPTPPPLRPAPAIDYLAKDYASFRRLLLERLSLTLPQWTERHAPDLWLTLVELLAHVGDRLSYQQDAVATEAYLGTARLRTSVRRHARLVGYPMHDGCAARTVVCVETSASMTLDLAEVAFGVQPEEEPPRSGGPVVPADVLAKGAHPVYRPLERRAVRLMPEHNGIPVWGWGGNAFELPAGTTGAALLDGDGVRRGLRLKPGDLLVLEEVRGPGGGPPDPGHRQAVRLTRVTRDRDAYTGTEVLKIAWADEDALTFPLSASVSREPDGRPRATVLARGNALLVEHGVEPGWPGGDADELIEVPQAGDGTAPAVPARRFRAVLRGAPVTWSPPYPRPSDVAAAQARQLLDLAARARDLLREVHHGVAELDDAERELLSALFGPSVLDDLARAATRRQVATRLLSRLDTLLEPRLRRLTTLARRALPGYVLDAADTGWELGQTWGPRAARALDPADPALHGPARSALDPDPREALPALDLVEATEPRARWTARRDLLASGPGDRHVVGECDDQGILTLRFGDGHCGRAAPPGTRLRAVYRVGNGRAGNAGSEAVNRIASLSGGLGAVTRVRNPLPVRGGTDPEPVARVRTAAPQAPFRTPLRAVTAEDYAVLAADGHTVQQAAATLRWTGSWYEADVAVDPSGPAVPAPALLEEVRTALHRFRRIGHDVVTRPALLVPLDVAVDVLVDPHHVTARVREALQRRLLPGRAPDGTVGFFDPAVLTFGTPVRVSALVAACMSVPGVRHAEVTSLRRLHAPGPEQRVPRVPASGELAVRPLEIARLDGDVTRPQDGRLTLRLRGGR